MASKWIFLFPGQGSQAVGMGRELSENFSEMKETFEEASEALGLSLQRVCFEDPESQLGLTEFTQPALLTVSVGTARILAGRAGLNAATSAVARIAGHSLGEYSALVAGGALDFAQAVKAVRFRGQAMQRAVPVGVGAMTAYVGAQTARVEEICRNETKPGAAVEVVNFNSRSQLVLSGHKLAVERVSKIIGDEKLGRAIALAVSAPFHSSLMKPAAEEMERYLEDIKLSPLGTTLHANVDAKPYTGTAYGKNMLVRQVASAVLWTQTLEAIRGDLRTGSSAEASADDAASRTWVEVGTGSVLQGLLKKTLDGETALGTADAAAVRALLAKVGA